MGEVLCVFLGLETCDRIPDAKTIWKFKDDLSKTNAAKDAFQLFENMLEKRKSYHS